MDLKYKHFRQARTFTSPREVVATAARRFMSESLGWSIADRADGFSAQGSSAAHNAIANFHIQSMSGGTSVDIELLVERAGVTGFMLFDVGGYYNIQIRHWFDGTQKLISESW